MASFQDNSCCRARKNIQWEKCSLCYFSSTVYFRTFCRKTEDIVEWHKKMDKFMELRKLSSTWWPGLWGPRPRCMWVSLWTRSRSKCRLIPNCILTSGNVFGKFVFLAFFQFPKYGKFHLVQNVQKCTNSAKCPWSSKMFKITKLSKMSKIN